MHVYNILLERKSCRTFTEQAIEPEKIEILKKAALLSPSGKRKNHWDFVFIQNNETINKLSLSKEHGSKFAENAPLIIAVIGNPEISDTWIEDCSIASIILQLEAEELGLGSCWVQIHKRTHNENVTSENYVKKLLSIPSNLGVLSLIAIGYASKKRKPTNEEELSFEKIHHEKY